MRTGIGITPVAIIGSHNMKKNQVACIIGKQVPVNKAKPTPEAIKEVNDRVKGEIQRMIDSYHENRICLLYTSPVEQKWECKGPKNTD